MHKHGTHVLQFHSPATLTYQVKVFRSTRNLDPPIRLRLWGCAQVHVQKLNKSCIRSWGFGSTYTYENQDPHDYKLGDSLRRDKARHDESHRSPLRRAVEDIFVRTKPIRDAHVAVSKPMGRFSRVVTFRMIV